ncbi:hypothetical protein DDI_3568 [Dickeya dianthicola RNS04.9]|nr:hypothetical protein DDI_3568 [Dickeya dianthicola RNS04.9]
MIYHDRVIPRFGAAFACFIIRRYVNKLYVKTRAVFGDGSACD